MLRIRYIERDRDIKNIKNIEHRDALIETCARHNKNKNIGALGSILAIEKTHKTINELSLVLSVLLC